MGNSQTGHAENTDLQAENEPYEYKNIGGVMVRVEKESHSHNKSSFAHKANNKQGA